MMKSMKIKFNSDDELPLNKTIEIPRINIISKFFYMNARHANWYLSLLVLFT